MKDNKVFMSPSEQAEYDKAIHAFDDLDSEDTEKPDDKKEKQIEQGELF